MADETVGTVVDVGCGTTPYCNLFSHTTYFGIETTISSRIGGAKVGADVLYDGKHLPLADRSIDNVPCNQVFEHVFEPIQFLSELHRVLRPGGRLMMTAPFTWDEHEQPHDYARYSSFGLRYLAGKCGFEITDARRTMADASILVQLWLAYWFKVIRRKGQPSFLRKLLITALCLPANIIGLILARDAYFHPIPIFTSTMQ